MTIAEAPESAPARLQPISSPSLSLLSIESAVAQFLKGYFATCRRSAKTRTAYEIDLRQFVADQPPSSTAESITPSAIEAWVAKMSAHKLATASIRRKIASLRVFFGFLVRRRLLDQSPLWQLRFDLVRERPLIRALDRADIDKLLSTARRIANVRGLRRSPERYLSERNHAIVALLFATGLRVGELCALSIPDFDSQNGSLRVLGKGGRERIAFVIDPQTKEVVRRYLRSRSKIAATHQALFLNRLGTRLSTQGIANALHGIAVAAGLQRHVTPHMLRHTVATLLLRNGADIRIVQEFLGHASIVTTQRYTHVAKEHLIQQLLVSHPNIRRDQPRHP
jgi:site-specific recombinase XerD